MSLTARDMEILSIAFQCLKDPGAFKVDYDKLASLAGFKTAASAANSFFLVKKKIGASGIEKKANGADEDVDGDANDVAAGEENGDGATAEPITPKTRKPRTRKPKLEQQNGPDANGAADANGEEGAAEPMTPTPKKRGRKPKAEPQSGDEVTTPKKRGRKTKLRTEEQDAEEHSSDETMPATPATPTPKKRKNAKVAKCEGENGDDAEDLASPTSPVTPKKRGRKSKDDFKPAAKRVKKSEAKVVEDSNDDEAEEATTTAVADTKMEDEAATAAMTGATITEAIANENTAADIISDIHGDGSSIFGPTSTEPELATAALKAVDALEAAAAAAGTPIDEAFFANAADDASITAHRAESELTELGPEFELQDY